MKEFTHLGLIVFLSRLCKIRCFMFSLFRVELECFRPPKICVKLDPAEGGGVSRLSAWVEKVGACNVCERRRTDKGVGGSRLSERTQDPPGQNAPEGFLSEIKNFPRSETPRLFSRLRY